jgi:hypothetical protein
MFDYTLETLDKLFLTLIQFICRREIHVKNNVDSIDIVQNIAVDADK